MWCILLAGEQIGILHQGVGRLSVGSGAEDRVGGSLSGRFSGLTGAL